MDKQLSEHRRQLGQTVLLVVGRDGEMRPAAQRVVDESCQVRPRPDLNKKPYPVGVHRLDRLAEPNLVRPLPSDGIADRVGIRLDHSGRAARPEVDHRCPDFQPVKVAAHPLRERGESVGVVRAVEL